VLIRSANEQRLKNSIEVFAPSDTSLRIKRRYISAQPVAVAQSIAVAQPVAVAQSVAVAVAVADPEVIIASEAQLATQANVMNQSNMNTSISSQVIKQSRDRCPCCNSLFHEIPYSCDLLLLGFDKDGSWNKEKKVKRKKVDSMHAEGCGGIIIMSYQ